MTERRPRIHFQAIARLAELADYTLPFAIRAVCKLGVADYLSSGPRSIEELSKSVGAHIPSLMRAMRALASRGVFAEPRPGYFELNPIGALLQTDHPLSMRGAFRMAPDLEALTNLMYTLRTGKSSFEDLFGEDYFTYLSRRPELLNEFHASQSALTRIEQVVLLRSYDWRRIQLIVDIGGGNGTFLGLLLAANPDLRGVLFDLPNTVEGAMEVLADFGVADRCEVVGGNFLDSSIPAGADAYVIKRVLVGLADEQAISVLAAVRRAMLPNGRLLICEPMMSEGDISAATDLLMLVLGPGRVRTPAEFEGLLAAADMKLTLGVTTPMFPFIEARPISSRIASCAALSCHRREIEFAFRRCLRLFGRQYVKELVVKASHEPSGCESGANNLLLDNKDTIVELAGGLLEMADYTTALAIRAASALGVADHLMAGSLPIDTLAQACGAKREPLRRLLRILVAKGVFSEPERDHFGLTPTGDLLREKHPYSMRGAFVLSPIEISVWSAFEFSIRTGRSAFQYLFGEDHRRYRKSHPEEDARMDRAHRAATRIEVQAIMRNYDWSKISLVVDVGGGTGAFLAGLLHAYKNLQGVLFDLPPMAEAARMYLADTGLSGRFLAVGGDFFDSVPAGADLYVLKSVIGGWDDDSASRILRCIRTSMRNDSRLLVIEPILQHGHDFTIGNIIHLQSLLYYGGPDRTIEDYERIFSQAELRLVAVVHRSTMPVMELRPALL
jgi:hypothetical protein